jgi:uracil-DNA glycosylase family 4
MNFQLPVVGPDDARIVILTDAPTQEDMVKQRPMSGFSGQEYAKLLHQIGLAFTDCAVISTMNTRPFDGDAKNLFTKFKPQGVTAPPEVWEDIARAKAEIRRIRPNVIVALGDVSLYALTGELSVSNWRGSMLRYSDGDFSCWLVPSYTSAMLQKVYEWRNIALTDLRRVKFLAEHPSATPPEYSFMLLASKDEYLSQLSAIIAQADLLKAEGKRLLLSCDIETIGHEMSCVGIGWSKHAALCVPIRTSHEYWTVEEELQIILKFRALLTHPAVDIVGQNFLYDIQYFARKWGFVPRLRHDTMMMMHVLFAGMPKDLAFIASLFCEWYEYWKDELKDYRSAPKDDLKFFRYNAKDCCYTYEIAETLLNMLEVAGLLEVYNFQMEVAQCCFDAMMRGVRINTNSRTRLANELLTAQQVRSKYVTDIVGYELNTRSPTQMKKFLYDEMGYPEQKNRKTKAVTANFEALMKLSETYPLLWPIANAIVDVRSIGVFLNTFVMAELDFDKRLRCSFNPGGPETFRLSSSENAFGSGTNLQNIPKGDRKKSTFKLPNIRELFIPDNGMTMFDVDLDRADLQVVVWEADDADLKRQLRLGVDLHIINGILLAGKEPPAEEELIATHPNYKEHAARYKIERQLAKNFVHGTNYGGKPPTMAAVCGINVAACAKLQERWFAIHPGILRWHRRVEDMLRRTRTVTNRFGYRRYYQGRIESVFNEALAWQPQSTVGIVINKGWNNIRLNMKGRCEVLIQVHDSLVGQYPTATEAAVLPDLRKNLTIEIPYPDPLIIPVGLKTSSTSWGECKDKEWDYHAKTVR